MAQPGHALLRSTTHKAGGLLSCSPKRTEHSAATGVATGWRIHIPWPPNRLATLPQPPSFPATYNPLLLQIIMLPAPSSPTAKQLALRPQLLAALTDVCNHQYHSNHTCTLVATLSVPPGAHHVIPLRVPPALLHATHCTQRQDPAAQLHMLLEAVAGLSLRCQCTRALVAR